MCFVLTEVAADRSQAYIEMARPFLERGFWGIFSEVAEWLKALD
jgi:hypothetical protein